MKKILYSIAVIAASAVAFSSCNKEKAIEETNPNDGLVTVTFTAEKAGLATKTAAVEGNEEVSYIWTDEDINNIKLFTVTTTTDEETGEEKENLTQVANPTVTKVSDTQLTISGKVAPGATYKFRAVLSGTWTSSLKPRLSDKQAPSATNFDPKADVLVSDDEEVTVAASDEETVSTSALEMTFRRLVVVNKMTLKNLTDGEKISKVVITSDQNLAGYFATASPWAASGDKKTITLNYDGAVVSGTTFPVYFTTIPQAGHSLTVEVTTDKYVYTKSFAAGKSIDFNLGQFTKFNFALLAGIPVVDVPDGDYFITALHDTDVYAAKKYISGNNLSNPLVINLDKDNETIDYTMDIEDCIFTITRITEGSYEGKYTIQDESGKYLYAAGGNASNHLKGEATPDADGNAYWTVSKNTDGTYDIESAGNATRNILRFNYNSGTPVFSCYGSGQTAITLYPASWCTLDTTPVLTIESEERAKEVLSAATSVVFNYTANRYASEPTVTVSSDTDGIIAENEGAAAITVTDGKITVGLVANTEDKVKTATLSVASTGLASAVTLTITQAAYTNLVSGNESFNLSTNSYSSASADAVVWEGTSVTITNNKGTSSTNANNYIPTTRTSTRFYTGQNLTIVPQAGYTITSVVFTAASSSYATALGNSTWSNGSASVDNTTVTITPQDGTNTISAVIGATCGFTQIVVNYLTAGSGGSGSGNGNTVTYSTFTYDSSTKTISGGDSVISILQEKGTGTNDVANYTSPIRLYSGHTLTVSAASGHTITSIVFGMNGTYDLSKVSSDSGTIEDLTWTGSSSSVVFTTTGQTRINTITVTYN